MTNFHIIHRVSHNNLTVVRSVEVPIIALLVKLGSSFSMSLVLVTIMTLLVLTNLRRELSLRNYNHDPLVDLYYPEGSDDYTDVTYDKEKYLSYRYSTPSTSPTYIPSIPCLATMEPADTLSMWDEVISTTPARENDDFIKSSVDDLVPIPRESEVTSVYNDLEFDMPATILLPTTDVREENLNINDSRPF
uniref:Uncharacterized protein n=1 Tax=Tanacetum cinerariifolium TaxID=118510 RepID=A0A699ITY6_TANCI|nr:hypothetical protein [Tanacetum cinerariifolium]